MTEDIYQPCAYVKGRAFVNNLIENAKSTIIWEDTLQQPSSHLHEDVILIYQCSRVS